MKKALTLLIVSCTLIGYGQQEKLMTFEFQERTSFYETNNLYIPLTDTIYHADSGFEIKAEYDIVEIIENSKKIKYVVFTYPDYKKGGKQERDFSKGLSRSPDPVHKELGAINGKTFMMKKDIFDKIEKIKHFSASWKNRKNFIFTSGIVTLPFKLRPRIDSTRFGITTDVTLGGYFGLTKRISRTKNYYVTLPVTLGLSFINIDNNNTSNSLTEKNDGIVAGITWSSGLMFQIENFNLGFVIGQDYASQVGDRWIYNGQLWYSFSIGYNFLKPRK